MKNSNKSYHCKKKNTQNFYYQLNFLSKYLKVNFVNFVCTGIYINIHYTVS